MRTGLLVRNWRENSNELPGLGPSLKAYCCVYTVSAEQLCNCRTGEALVYCVIRGDSMIMNFVSLAVFYLRLRVRD